MKSFIVLLAMLAYAPPCYHNPQADALSVREAVAYAEARGVEAIPTDSELWLCDGSAEIPLAIYSDGISWYELRQAIAQ